ncbi:MAG: helix-turn-helix domain-containing protein [Vicinamibacterales bacterium]
MPEWRLQRAARPCACLLPTPSLYADRRIEILKSAAAAFRRRGYHGASVDDHRYALEMTKGNLYYYFRNKEEIPSGLSHGYS